MDRNDYEFGMPVMEIEDAKRELAEFLPSIHPEHFRSPLMVERHIDYFYAKQMLSDETKYEWRYMYDLLMQELSKMLYGNDNYFIIRCIPTKTNDFPHFQHILKLYLEVMICPTENFAVPVFRYERTSTGAMYVREWKCGYCGSPNTIANTHCTQCGGSRAKLIQEML